PPDERSLRTWTFEADGSAPSASSAAAPPRSLKLSDNTPTLMPLPLTLSPLSSSACCTWAAFAPPEPTAELVTAAPGPELSRDARLVIPVTGATASALVACEAGCKRAASTPLESATVTATWPARGVGIRLAKFIETADGSADCCGANKASADVVKSVSTGGAIWRPMFGPEFVS